MAKIAVFDSGLGSLSIIKEIQKIMKADIVYFADQKNYPYGTKSQAQMASIIKKTADPEINAAWARPAKASAFP